MLVIFSILVVALSFVNGLDNGQYNTFVTAEQYTSSVINPNILEDSILSPVRAENIELFDPIISSICTLRCNVL